MFCRPVYQSANDIYGQKGIYLINFVVFVCYKNPSISGITYSFHRLFVYLPEIMISQWSSDAQVISICSQRLWVEWLFFVFVAFVVDESGISGTTSLIQAHFVLPPPRSQTHVANITQPDTQSTKRQYPYKVYIISAHFSLPHIFISLNSSISQFLNSSILQFILRPPLQNISSSHEKNLFCLFNMKLHLIQTLAVATGVFAMLASGQTLPQLQEDVCKGLEEFDSCEYEVSCRSSATTIKINIKPSWQQLVAVGVH